MSHSEDFKDSSSKRHLFAALSAMIAAPLLPAVMGWFAVLS